MPTKHDTGQDAKADSSSQERKERSLHLENTATLHFSTITEFYGHDHGQLMI